MTIHDIAMYAKKVKAQNANRTHTCSGEREKDLFPIVNITSGRAAILSHSINGFPKGLGSLSHTFNTKKLRKRRFLVTIFVCLALDVILENQFQH